MLEEQGRTWHYLTFRGGKRWRKWEWGRKPKSLVIWQILTLIDMGAGNSLGTKLTEQPFHPLKSLILHEDTQLQFTFVIRSALYAA